MSKLVAEELRRGLATRIIGREIYVFDLVISTSDVMWELADRGAGEGTVVFAEEQTRGRGRLGRTWWSPRGGGVWMSVLLRPESQDSNGADCPDFPAMTTIIGALAAADAVRAETRLPAMIRWPNDIFVEGKKVGGVLVEARQTARGRELTLGIGINVGMCQAEMPADIMEMATSLSEAAGEDIDRPDFARALLRELDRWYGIELDRDTESINRRWRELCATLGKRVVLEERGRQYEGEVIDVDVHLGLALRLDRGNIRHFRGEHVSVIRHA